MSEPKSHWWEGLPRKREYAEPLSISNQEVSTEAWKERQARMETLAEFRRNVLILTAQDEELLRGMKIEC